MPQLDSLANHSLVPLMATDLNVTMADFVLEDGSWNWQRLLLFFLLVFVITLQVWLLLWIWVYTILSFGKAVYDGVFSVKIAYDYISNTVHMDFDPIFRLIWKWKGMEWIKVFLWLPTNYFRFSRHISDDATCSRFWMNLYETTLHVLRDSVLASSFWARLMDLISHPIFYTANLLS